MASVGGVSAPIYRSLSQADFRGFYFHKKEVFFSAIKNKQEEEISELVRNSCLGFLKQGESLKVRKSYAQKLQTKPNAKKTHSSERSNVLSRSLFIMPKTGTIFHDNKSKLSSCGAVAHHRLGKGGDKTAWQIGPDRVIAKLHSDHPNPGNMGQQEYEHTSRINSPNILPILGYSIHTKSNGQQVCYLESELCQGSLDDLIAGRVRKVASTSDFINAIDSAGRAALQACHAAGIAHHDLDFGNVFIDTKGTIRLGDFSHSQKLPESEEERQKIIRRELEAWGEKMFDVQAVLGRFLL